MTDAEQALVRTLEQILEKGTDRNALIHEFQQLVWNAPATGTQSACWRIFADLAYDLDYYEGEARKLIEDPSFFGDERLEREVQVALQRIKETEVERAG